MIISIIGFMGAGKSTITQRLSKLLSSPYIDLDLYIEAKEGRTIDEIFSNCGETGFREIEERYLKELISTNTQKVLFLSLGGGSLTSDSNRQLIKDNTICIYLKASADTLVKRLSKSRKIRPLISGTEPSDLKDQIESLLNKRQKQYEDTASITIDIDGLSTNGIIERILCLI